MSTAALSHLSDRDLLAEVSRLATGQRDATVSLIAHLAELHPPRLHQPAGVSSPYTDARAVPEASRPAGPASPQHSQPRPRADLRARPGRARDGAGAGEVLLHRPAEGQPGAGGRLP